MLQDPVIVILETRCLLRVIQLETVYEIHCIYFGP